MGKDRSCWEYSKGNLNQLYNHDLNDSPIFHGRRKGRKLSKSNQLALKIGSKYIIDKEDFEAVFFVKKHNSWDWFWRWRKFNQFCKQNSNFSILELILFKCNCTMSK